MRDFEQFDRTERPELGLLAVLSVPAADDCSRAGLSRAEYLRRTIDREASRSDETATIDDLRKFDLLADEHQMSGTWD
ncbi:MAG: hypothetical protein ACTIIH_00545 [Brevibacterium sp.]|uniref:hypothetical protein n=1 Tax=Brevibacterium sp. TaxID=1701 RepID=UPI003F9230BB